VKGLENWLRWGYRSAMAGALPVSRNPWQGGPSHPLHPHATLQPSTLSGAASVDDDARSDVRGWPWRWRSRIILTTAASRPPRHYGLTVARAGHVSKDVPDVATGVKQQLQHSSDGDEAVVSLVGSNDAPSNQVYLVWIRTTSVDEVLVSELR